MKKLTITVPAVLLLVFFMQSAAFGQITGKIYGFIKLDMSYDNEKMSVGNYARWVDQPDGNSYLNITARQSRLGYMFTGSANNGITTDGQVEIDFYNGDVENKNIPMLRKAFFKINFSKGFSILAGQTSDVISPLVPGTVNYVVSWWAGNIGYRRPQLRFSSNIKIGDNGKFLLDVAALRAIGGEYSGAPCFQGRAALSLGNTTLGISAHSGKEADETTSSSMNVDLSIGLSRAFAITGEYFQGSNLDAYLGGIAQGVNAAGDEIDSKGGWVAVAVKPGGSTSFNLGTSMDDPDDSMLDDGSRSKNTCIFGNIFIQVTQAAKIGVEVSKWSTEYKNQDTKSSLRFQCTFIHGL